MSIMLYIGNAFTVDTSFVIYSDTLAKSGTNSFIFKVKAGKTRVLNLLRLKCCKDKF